MPVDFAKDILREPVITEGMSHDFAAELEQDVKTDQEYLVDVLQNNFDAENFADSGLRLRLANADNFSEKNLVIQNQFPEGEYRVVGKSIIDPNSPDNPVAIWRESPQSQWKQVEPPGFDLTDIGEAVAPSALSIASEIAAAIFTRGATVPTTIGKIAAGAAAGETIDQVQQTARGVQDQTLGEQAAEVGTEAGLSAVGGFVASPLVGAGNVLSGRGALQVGPQGLETIQAAGRIDPRLQQGLTPGLVTDNPALMLNERQSAALLPGLQRRYRELGEILNEAVAGRVNRGALANASKNVLNGVRNLGNAFIKNLGVRAKRASEGGRALQQGIEEYSKTSKQMVDRLYDAARQIEEPQFDFSTLRNTAADLRAGAKGTIDPTVERLIRETEGIRGPITLSDGSVLTVSDQLRNARTGAFAAKAIKPGEVADQSTGQANDLFKAINKVLDNPVSDNPAFVNAWRSAADAASDRFTTLGKGAIIKAGRSENPAELLAFAKPGQVDNLLTLRNTVSNEKWKSFTNAFETQLIEDPRNLARNLDAFDQETLDVLIPRANQAQWKRVGKEMARIFDLDPEKIIETQIRNKNVVASLVEGANPQRTRTLLRAANQTNNRGFRDSMRSGIFDWTWDGIVTPGKRGLVVNDKLLERRLNSLQKSGLMQFLTPEDALLLRDVETMSRVFKRVIDAGTSIQAAEAAKGIGRLERGAIRSFIQAGIISRLYLSSTGRKILIGSGRPNSKGGLLRALTGALVQTSQPQPIEIEEQ